MAITAVLRLDRPTFKSWGLIATLNTDSVLSVAHGMGAEPEFDPAEVSAWVQGIRDEARRSNWLVAVDALNITISKEAIGGSGASEQQAVLYLMLPHSLM